MPLSGTHHLDPGAAQTRDVVFGRLVIRHEDIDSRGGAHDSRAVHTTAVGATSRPTCIGLRALSGRRGTAGITTSCVPGWRRRPGSTPGPGRPASHVLRRSGSVSWLSGVGRPPLRGGSDHAVHRSSAACVRVRNGRRTGDRPDAVERAAGSRTRAADRPTPRRDGRLAHRRLLEATDDRGRATVAVSRGRPAAPTTASAVGRHAGRACTGPCRDDR